MPLQRVVTDLGADLPFAQAAGKLREHYGVVLSPSTIRQVTEGHARALTVDSEDEPAWPTQAGVATVIAEVDGGMVPLVEVDPDRADRRRGKRLLWKEAKVSLAHAHGSTTRVYDATLGGGVEVAGRQLLGCAIAAGLGATSRVHALGDGAAWIADQVATRFGTQGSYTVDFFHVCDYLADAAKGCAPDAPKSWLELQKTRLKNNDITAVLAALSEALDCRRARCGRPGAHLSSLSEQPARSARLPRRPRTGVAHRLRGDRKRPPLHRTTAPQAPRRLVGARQRRGHARLARCPRKRAWSVYWQDLRQTA